MESGDLDLFRKAHKIPLWWQQTTYRLSNLSHIIQNSTNNFSSVYRLIVSTFRTLRRTRNTQDIPHSYRRCGSWTDWYKYIRNPKWTFKEFSFSKLIFKFFWRIFLNSLYLKSSATEFLKPLSFSFTCSQQLEHFVIVIMRLTADINNYCQEKDKRQVRAIQFSDSNIIASDLWSWKILKFTMKVNWIQSK